MNPSGFFTYVGNTKTDLIDVFDPLIGTKTNNTGFRSTNNNNKDLAELFEPYVTGTKAAATKYRVFSTNKDLSDTFKAVTPFPTYNGGVDQSLMPQRAQYMCINNNNALVCYPNNYMYYSNNYGKTYTQSNVDGALNTAKTWRGVAIYGANAVACDVSNIYYSTNYGASFTKLTAPTDSVNSFTGVAIYENYALAVTTNGTGKLYVSTNSGASFNQITSTISGAGGFYRQPSISKRPDGSYNAVISVFDIATPANCKIKYTNNFTGSTTADTYRDASINNASVNTVFNGGLIAQLDGNNGVACSFSGADSTKCFVYTTDGGASWSYGSSSVTGSYVHSVAIDGSFCIGSGGATYYISKNSGVSWTGYPVPTAQTGTGQSSESTGVSNGYAVLNARGTNGAYNYYGRIL